MEVSLGQIEQGLDDLQAIIHEWRKNNFELSDPDEGAIQCILGVGEEVGELMRSFVKERQGIRGSSEYHVGQGQDAVGDIIIFLMGYCSHRGWSVGECLMEAWGEVSKRNWKENKEDGTDRTSTGDHR